MVKLRTHIFQAWFRFSRPMTLGVRAIVENASGQVVLVRHSYTPGLYLPGGGVERGEPALHALKRELIEEAGVEMTGDAQLVGIYSNHAVFKNDHVLLYLIKSNQWKPCTRTSRGEINESLWIDPKHPPDDITPGNGRRLREIYNGASRCLYW